MPNTTTHDACKCGRSKPIAHALCPACRARRHRDARRAVITSAEATIDALVAALAAR